jgi:hypothetical protein
MKRRSCKTFGQGGLNSRFWPQEYKGAEGRSGGGTGEAGFLGRGGLALARG